MENNARVWTTWEDAQMTPIVELLYRDIQNRLEDGVIRACQRVDVVVDKPRLMQALADAKAFWEEGYTAGRKACGRSKGEWVEHDCFICNSDGEPVIKRGSVFVCSECGREERYREPFCHCGADMREGNACVRVGEEE